MFGNLSQDNCRSSILEKIPEDLRRQVDFAILENLFPTLRGLWLHFELGQKGVSYIAMYRYARHLRDRTNRAELAEIAADPDIDLTDKVQTVITQHILDRFMDEDELDPRDVKRLASTLRLMSRIGLEKKQLSEDSRLAWARLEHDRQALQLNAEKLQLFRQRFVEPPEPQRLPIDQSANGHTRAGPQLAIIDQPGATELLAASQR